MNYKIAASVMVIIALAIFAVYGVSALTKTSDAANQVTGAVTAQSAAYPSNLPPKSQGSAQVSTGMVGGC